MPCPCAGSRASSPARSACRSPTRPRRTSPVRTCLGGPLDYVGPDVYPARIADPTGCDRFVLREVRGFDPSARTPLPMVVRLARSGVRSVSLAVDVTNYLMFEL